MQRTLIADTVHAIGESVYIQGWVNKRRDHGKIMFLDIRDRSGVVQTVATKALADARSEYVVAVIGTVKKRPEGLINPKIATGTIEIEVEQLTILSPSRELPFPLDSEGHDINEEIRLQYRYLDLRRERLQNNIKLRSRFVDMCRQFLFSQGFTEIETPLLTKSTPEGSRDFLVPSRLQPGKWYALPQSPQQYKQLLMAAGFERYFQIARCLRDEDLRADRGFEHTQIDMEMSFVTREDVMALDEAMITQVVESLGYKIKQKPFPIFTYQQAMQTYGADKFDMRTDEEKKQGILAFAWVIDFPFFEKTEGGGYTFTHNPFSNPKPEHEQWLLEKSHIEEILTTQYDMVCNGFEVGGGSIRSHNPRVLRSVFEIMGYERAKIEEQFGHMLEAFSYGIPPHGGLAHGVERLLMTLTGEPYLREVVAFPQTASGKTSIMQAPSLVSDEQLTELNLAITKKTGHDVYNHILAEIDKHKVSYTAYEHRPVTTSEEAAQVRNTPLSWGAKAMLLYVQEKPCMVVLPGDKKIDMKAFKQLVQDTHVRMASPQEVLGVTHVSIGAVPPFGHIFSIPIYADISLKNTQEIFFNAGLHEKSIQMKEQDYERVANPTFGEFAK